MKKLLVFLCAMILLICTAQQVVAKRYRVTNIAEILISDLGAVGGNNAAFAINESGQVVGHYHDGMDYRVFLYDDGSATNPGSLSGLYSYAYDVNESGNIVGHIYINKKFNAFLYKNGVAQYLGAHDGAAWEESEAWAINDSSQTVGMAYTESGNQHAFLWDENGGMQDLGTLGGAHSYAYGINNSGEVVGTAITVALAYHAFLYNGTMHDLGTLGGTNSYSNAINSSGMIVGSSDLRNGEEHAILYDNGRMVDLGTIESGDRSESLAINDLGQIVGRSSTTPWSTFSAFLYEDGAMLDLNDLIDPKSGWILSEAHGINNSGQIVGFGYNTSSGGRSAFVLTPSSDDDDDECVISYVSGSVMGPHVNKLREFRDRVLLKSPGGKAFVEFYYSCSPPIVKFIANHESLKEIVRLSLLPVIGICWAALHLGPFAFFVFVFLLTLISARMAELLYKRFGRKEVILFVCPRQHVMPA